MLMSLPMKAHTTKGDPEYIVICGYWGQYHQRQGQEIKPLQAWVRAVRMAVWSVNAIGSIPDTAGCGLRKE